MAEPITTETVARVATLARLRLDHHRMQPLATELTAILTHFDALAKINTDDIEPMAHPMDRTNCLRDDTIGQMLPPETLRDIAPAIEGNLLAVPKVIDEGSA